MEDIKKTIRVKSDVEILAMLGDESSYTSKAIDIALEEQERRGGRCALDEALKVEETRIQDLNTHETAVRLPLRGRIVAHLWFWSSLLVLVPKLLSFDLAQITSNFTVSTVIRLILAASVLRASRIGIVLFSVALGFSAFRVLWYAFVSQTDHIVSRLALAGFLLACAIVVASCFNAARRIHKYLGSPPGEN